MIDSAARTPTRATSARTTGDAGLLSKDAPPPWEDDETESGRRIFEAGPRSPIASVVDLAALPALRIPYVLSLVARGRCPALRLAAERSIEGNEKPGGI
jgi:hypothetical protein